MNRKFLILGIMASLWAFGCSDDSGEEPVSACNNNGVLDADEVCDGTNFAAGKQVCPEGKVLAEGKALSDIKCSDKCAVVTDGICVDPTPASCNNDGVLNDGEDCDGTAFADGKRVCPEGKVLAEGKTLSDIICSDKCAVVTDGVCVDPTPVPTPASCNNDGTLDDGEDCDGTAFAAGKQVCPAGMRLAPNKTNGDITCSSECKVIYAAACVEDAQNLCGNKQLDTASNEICDGNLFADGKRVCPAGYQFKDGKTVDDITCTDSCALNTDDACEQTLIESCDGTKYCICDSTNTSCECEDCADRGMICKTDGSNAKCVERECDPGTPYSCSADNTTVELCVQNDGDTVGYLLTQKCNSDEVCEMQTDGTAKCDLKPCEAGVNEGDYKCEGSVLFVCMEDTPSANRWIEDTDCSLNGQKCDDFQGCVDVPKCGNGILDYSDGELCDQTESGTQFNTYKENIDCYRYDQRTSNERLTNKTLYTNGGPTCTAECKISIASCEAATEEDYTVLKKWNFSSLSDVINNTKGGSVTMNGTFGSGYSEWSTKHSGWSLGNWSKNEFGKSITFAAGKLNENAVNVSIDVTRTDNNSPKQFKIRLLNGTNTLATTEALEITEKDTKHTLNANLRNLKNISDLRIQFTAYGTDKTNHVVINNIVVNELTAL